MSAANKILFFADARLYKGIDDVVVNLLAALRRTAIEGQIATLGRYHYFVAADRPAGDHFRDRASNSALAPLEPVVRGGVDYVGSQLECASDGRTIRLVGPVIKVTQVRTQTD